MRADILNSNSSAYALASGENLVKVKSKVVQHGAAATTIASGAISVPAKSIITRLTCIVEDALAQASGNVGVSAGTAAAGTQFTGTLDADCLEASSTSVAAGVGTSTDDVLTAALGGTAIMGALANAYRESATEVHFTATSSGGNFTANTGSLRFIVEYIEMDDSYNV
jgi:hypothetical protein|tara:strand:+ start:124 stop:627 length:504 start_codon:yes stop_codon:yes gene_type:complete